MSHHIAKGPARSFRLARQRPNTRRDSTRPRTAGLSPRVASRLERPRVADLFAGVGGFHLAFESAGGDIVFASENDRFARATYEANFRLRNAALFEADNFAGDIQKVEAAAVPDFDVLAAGFPCQPFSIAGSRAGFADTRGTLFFEIARILDEKRPAAFCLENVPGLLSHDRGRTFKIIEGVLSGLGYSFHHRVVRACDFGLPQLRPRLYMVGFRDEDTPFRFPDPVPLTLTLSDVFGGHVNREVGYTILASGRGHPFGGKRCWDGYLVNGELRRLGVDEARRMQGFPDDFIFPVSMSQAMKQLGNAVAVPAAAAVAREVVRSLQATLAPVPVIGGTR